MNIGHSAQLTTTEIIALTPVRLHTLIQSIRTLVKDEEANPRNLQSSIKMIWACGYKEKLP